MPRLSWYELPDRVRDAVESQCGSVIGTVGALAGTNSDFVGTLHAAGGKVFCKAARVSSPGAWMLDNEVRVNLWLPDAAPRLLWQVETDGWRVCGFEHIDGRHADLAPGSPDLPLIADSVAKVACDVTDWPIAIQPIEYRWRLRTWHEYQASPPDDLDPWVRKNLDRLVAIEAKGSGRLSGATLVHTDPVAANFLVDGDRVRIVDWGWPARGAPWIDTAFLVVRLLTAGHSPMSAERWAAAVPAWSAAPPKAITAFAAFITGFWEHKNRTDPAPHQGTLTAAARRWTRHRLRLTP